MIAFLWILKQGRGWASAGMHKSIPFSRESKDLKEMVNLGTLELAFLY
jgi:hypothetical protein